LINTQKIKIDDLFKHEWLSELTQNNNIIKEIEKNVKTYFNDRYQKLLESKKQCINVDINSQINLSNNKNNSLFSCFNRSSSTNNEYKDNLEIQKLDNCPQGIIFDYIEIILKNNEDLDNDNNNKNLPYNFMFELKKEIENMEEVKEPIEYSDKYLSYDITFKENLFNETNEDNEENENDNEKNNDEDKEDNDIINSNNKSYDKEGIEPLIINIELFEYNKKSNYDDLYSHKIYYLMFNYIQGETYDYYYYLKIIKQKVQDLCKK
jgi:hypothetical protein